MTCRPPPRCLDELLLRAQALCGRSVGEVAQALGVPGISVSADPRRTKGLCGALVERALGASAGSAAGPDFPALGVELKTVPLSPALRPRESTYVCAVNLGTLPGESWRTSAVRRKLARVLWVPVEGAASGPLAQRRFLRPRYRELGGADEELLRADWEELVAIIGTGGVTDLGARTGRCLQVRPKAADGRARVVDVSSLVPTGPRGFYLRASFTRTQLA